MQNTLPTRMTGRGCSRASIVFPVRPRCPAAPPCAMRFRCACLLPELHAEKELRVATRNPGWVVQQPGEWRVTFASRMCRQAERSAPALCRPAAIGTPAPLNSASAKLIRAAKGAVEQKTVHPWTVLPAP